MERARWAARCSAHVGVGVGVRHPPVFGICSLGGIKFWWFLRAQRGIVSAKDAERRLIWKPLEPAKPLPLFEPQE